MKTLAPTLVLRSRLMSLFDTRPVDFVVIVRVNGLSVDDAVCTAENVSGNIDFRAEGEMFERGEEGHAEIAEWMEHPEWLHEGRAQDTVYGAYAVTVTRRAWCNRVTGEEEDYDRLATGCRREGDWEAGLPASVPCAAAIETLRAAQAQAGRLDKPTTTRGRRLV